MHPDAFTFVLIPLWLLLGTETPQAMRGWGNPPVRSKWLSTCCFVVAATGLDPAIAARLGVATPLYGAAAQLSLWALLAATIAFRPCLRYLLDPGQVLPLPLRGPAVAGAVVLAVAATAIANLAPHPAGVVPSLLTGDPGLWPGETLTIGAYLALVPLALAGVAFQAFAQLGGRLTAVRASFGLQTLAWLCGAGLPLEMLAAALTGRIRHAPPPHYAAWIAANLVGFAVLMLVALWLPPLAAWAYHARAYPRLRGLWEPLRAATGGYLLPYPELAGRRSLAVWRDPEKYTTYLCGALRDDALRLSGWVADGVLERAARLAHRAGAPAGAAEATRDAICLHYALLRHGQAAATPPRGGWALGGLEVADIAGEVAYLCHVARAFRASEVRQLAIRLAAGELDESGSMDETRREHRGSGAGQRTGAGPQR